MRHEATPRCSVPAYRRDGRPGWNRQPGRLGRCRDRDRAASAARGRRSAAALRLRLGPGILALERSPPRLGQRLLGARAPRLPLDPRPLDPRRSALAIRPRALGALMRATTVATAVTGGTTTPSRRAAEAG